MDISCQDPFAPRNRHTDDLPVVQPVKEVQPRFDVRIDTGRLLGRKELTAEGFNAERHLRQLILRRDDSPAGEAVWMRVSRQCSGVFIECADQAADDLEQCDHTFIQLFKVQDGVGFLEELAAPSFPGKKALNVVWNLMATFEMNEAIFTDGSMLLPKTPCCEDGALTDLRPLSVFTDGMSWYEKQGATAKVSQRAFRTAYLAVDDSVVFSPDPRLQEVGDFDRAVFERCALYLTEAQPSRRAYISACSFLHSLPISMFDASLSLLSKRYPSLEILREVIRQASSANGTRGSLGELMRSVMARKEDKEFHPLHHEIRDRLVSAKDAIYSQYLSDAFSDQTLPTEILCALAFSVVEESACSVMKADDGQLEVMTKKKCEEIWKQTVIIAIKPSYAQRKALKKESCEQIWERAKKVFPDTPKPSANPILSQQIREMSLWLFEHIDEIAAVKVSANSNRVQRQRYLHYTQGTLSDGFFHLMQQALFYLVRLPMARLSSACPELVDFLKTKFQLIGETTLEELMNSSSASERELIMRELLHGHEKHLSAIFVRYMDRHPIERIPLEVCYAIFTLSKHICQSRAEFTLKL